LLQMLFSKFYNFSAVVVASFVGVVRSGCNITTIGSPDEFLLKGTVLTGNGALCDSHVFVHSGKIAYVGSGHELDSILRHGNATVIDCTGSVISPGFINTHEHIGYSTITPLADIGERADQRHDWRVGARNFTERSAPVNGSEYDATKWGELRHIFSGTTSIVGGQSVLKSMLGNKLIFPTR